MKEYFLNTAPLPELLFLQRTISRWKTSCFNHPTVFLTTRSPFLSFPLHSSHPHRVPSVGSRSEQSLIALPQPALGRRRGRDRARSGAGGAAPGHPLPGPGAPQARGLPRPRGSPGRRPRGMGKEHGRSGTCPRAFRRGGEGSRDGGCNLSCLGFLLEEIWPSWQGISC